MHRAHGVEVLKAGCSLKDGAAVTHLHDEEIQRSGYGRIGQFTAQHRLHLLQARHVGDLLAPGHAGARAGIQPRQDVALLREPVFKKVVCGHGV